MSTETMSDAPDTFDLHDVEAMEQVISHASHALGERALFLENELRATQDIATQARDALARQVTANVVLRSFAEWVLHNSEEGGGIAPQDLASRARKALGGCPEDPEENES